MVLEERYDAVQAEVDKLNNDKAVLVKNIKELDEKGFFPEALQKKLQAIRTRL